MSYLGHSYALELRPAQRAELRAGREEVVFEASKEPGDVQESQIRGIARREHSYGHCREEWEVARRCDWTRETKMPPSLLTHREPA